MKKIIFAFIMLFSICSFAQAQHKVFCELVGTGKFMSSKVIVTVDFGQKTSYWSGGAKQVLVDEKGEKLEFNSMVDAMNYFGKRGWDFQQAYVVTTSNQNVYHWLLSKKVNDDKELLDGFMTKEQFEKNKPQE